MECWIIHTESIDNKSVHLLRVAKVIPFFLLDPLQFTYLSQTYYFLF
jgi:hypothetical protein